MNTDDLDDLIRQLPWLHQVRLRAKGLRGTVKVGVEGVMARRVEGCGAISGVSGVLSFLLRLDALSPVNLLMLCGLVFGLEGFGGFGI